MSICNALKIYIKTLIVYAKENIFIIIFCQNVLAALGKTDRLSGGQQWTPHLCKHPFHIPKGVKRQQHRSKKRLKGQHTIYNTQNTQHKHPFHIPKRGKKPTHNTGGLQHDICHKHHKQRLCKIIITRVKVHFLAVF